MLDICKHTPYALTLAIKSTNTYTASFPSIIYHRPNSCLADHHCDDSVLVVMMALPLSLTAAPVHEDGDQDVEEEQETEVLLVVEKGKLVNAVGMLVVAVAVANEAEHAYDAAALLQKRQLVRRQCEQPPPDRLHIPLVPKGPSDRPLYT